MSEKLTESKVRDIAGETAQQLRRGGMDPAKAERVGVQIASHVAAKVEGKPVPEHFRPIHDANKRR